MLWPPIAKDFHNLILHGIVGIEESLMDRALGRIDGETIQIDEPIRYFVGIRATKSDDHYIFVQKRDSRSWSL